MYSIFYTPESEDNLDEIFRFISDDNMFYATKVVISIKNIIDILKLFPLSWKSIDKDNKMIIESTYKYNIIYKIKWHEIYILSIFKYKNLK